jgi:hypothetical protein
VVLGAGGQAGAEDPEVNGPANLGAGGRQLFGGDPR